MVFYVTSTNRQIDIIRLVNSLFIDILTLKNG
jgi:hypothetical protein